MDIATALPGFNDPGHSVTSDPSTVPARPASQTHKFPKGRTNLVPRASIWTQKITTTIIAYVFYSLDRASDRIRRYGTAYFANIHIRIIRVFFHIKQKIIVLY